MARKPKKQKTDLGAKALEVLFPGRREVDEYNRRNVDLPATAAGYFDGTLAQQVTDPVNHVFAMASDEDQLIHQLPTERTARYAFLEAMAEDPTIDSAVKMHIAHALSADVQTGEIIKIESSTDADNPIVEDLKATFQDEANRKCQEWAFTAATLGANYLRLYGGQGQGVTHIRNDYYTHPRFLREYEQAGRLAGYTCSWQGGDAIRLMDPWTWVPVKIPFWRRRDQTEPTRTSGDVLDIAREDYESEGLVESQNYGESLIETAYGPWFDLMEAILSLNMSRKNAARLERMIGVNTGKLDPTRAAKYLNTISGQIQKTDKDLARRSLRKGFVQTVLNHIIPIFGDSKGRLDISTLEGTPDIQGVEDVNFHVKRLGSALGIDPALLGFGEMLSGGLGDGGFFRISILAAIKAQMLRRAVKSALERIFEVHVAWKHGKVFLPGEKPWRIVFNSVSTALEREERENTEGRANLAMAIAGLVPTIDPEMSTVSKREFANYLFTDLMRMEEDKFKEVFPEELAKKAEEAAAAGDGQGGGLFESAQGKEELRAEIYEVLSKFYEEDQGGKSV
jgi:hypothetical protein